MVGEPHLQREEYDASTQSDHHRDNTDEDGLILDPV